jgi:hypothetical protein
MIKRKILYSTILTLFICLTFFLILPFTYSSKVKDKLLTISNNLPGNSLIDISKYEKGLFESKAKVTISILNNSNPIAFYGTINIEHGLSKSLNLFNPFTKADKKEAFVATANLSPISTEDIKITSNPQVENISIIARAFANKSLTMDIRTPQLNVLQKNSRYEILPSKAHISHSIDGSKPFTIEGVTPKLSFINKEFNGFTSALTFKIGNTGSDTLSIDLYAENTNINGKINASGKKLEAKTIVSSLNNIETWSLENSIKYRELTIFNKRYTNSKILIDLDNIPNNLDTLRLLALYNQVGMNSENTPGVKFNMPIRMAVDVTDFFINKHFTSNSQLLKIKGNEKAVLEFQKNRDNLATSYIVGLIHSNLCKQDKDLSLNCSIKIQEDGINISGKNFKRNDPTLAKINLGRTVSKHMPAFYETVFGKLHAPVKQEATENKS